MKHLLYCLLIILVAVIFISSSCYAQYQTSDKSLFGVSMVMMRPSSPILKDLKPTWLGPSVQANIRYDKYDRPNLIASTGWLAEEKNGLSASLLPITATYIKRFKVSDNRAWYVGGGLGAYLVSCKFYNTSNSNTKYGVNLVLGHEFGGWYAELRSDNVGSVNNKTVGNLDLGSWSFSIGTRLAM